METRRCWQCDAIYQVTDTGKFSHRCVDGSLIVVGTSYEDFDIVAILEDT